MISTYYLKFDNLSSYFSNNFANILAFQRILHPRPRMDQYASALYTGGGGVEVDWDEVVRTVADDEVTEQARQPRLRIGHAWSVTSVR